MANFGALATEIGLPVWGTPAYFNGFRVLASLLHRRRLTDVNQTLHSVWPSPGLYTFPGALALREFCQLQNSLCSKSCAFLYWQRYCTALELWA